MENDTPQRDGQGPAWQAGESGKQAPVEDSTPAPQPEGPAPAPGWAPPPAGTPTAQPYWEQPYTGGYAPSGAPRRGGARWAWGAAGCILAATLVLGLVCVLAAAFVGTTIVRVASGPAVTTTINRTFTVASAPAITVNVSAGNVTIRQAGTGQVTIRATKNVRGTQGDAAQRALAGIPVEFSQSGNAITVRSQFASNWTDGGLGQRSVDLLITVPEGSTIRSTLGAGTTDISGVAGVLHVNTGAGTITARDLTFLSASRFETGTGNVTVAGRLAPGAALDLHVGAGNASVSLPADTPAQLDAAAAVGNVSVSGWPAVTIVRSGVTGQTASGPLGENATGSVTLRVGTGNISVTAR
jgi:hypothetical protein